MPCEDYRPLVRRLGEKDLPADQEALLREHLPSCPSCRRAVALLGMEDEALASILVGLGPERRTRSSRILRITTLLGVVLGILLVGLYVLYRALGERIEDARARKTAAVGLERIVRPGLVDAPMSRVLYLLEDQAGCPLELIGPGGGSGSPVTLDLDKGIRLRSALRLLAELYGARFRVGIDGVSFPSEEVGVVQPATEGLRRRLESERVSIAYDGHDLRGALRYLGNLLALNLVVVPSARTIVEKAPARLTARDAPLGEVLDGLLRASGLTYEVRHEVVLIHRSG